MKICVTGEKNSGKSTFLNYLKKYNWKVYQADDFIRKIYIKNEIGYKFVLSNFGSDYVTPLEVNRARLNDLVVNDNKSLKKLNEFACKEIFKWIESLDGENLIFELGIYLINEQFFKELFDKVILIRRKGNYVDKNHISKFLIEPKNFSFDYVLENNSSIEEFIEKINIFCKTLNKY